MKSESDTQLGNWLRERTIVRGARSPSWEAGSGANNSSFFTQQHAYRTIIRHASLALEEHRTKEKKKQRHGSPRSTNTEQSESESDNPTPTPQLVKPDPARLTEHTKCWRYFVGVTLLCSIVCGSLWVFVAIFMRFCATS